MSFMKSKKPAQMSDEASMKEGKPSLAIAFSTQRHNKKKMAFGGKAEATQEPAVPGRKEDDTRPAKEAYMGDKFAYGGMAEATGEPSVPKRKPDDSRRPKDAYAAPEWAGQPELDDASDTSMRPPEEQYMGDKFARGGEVHPSELMTDDERSSSIAEAIMRKRKMMAEGGQVDLEENSEESLNNEDQMSFEAGDKEQYDLSQLSSQPEDSNEKGDSREAATSDKHDMISQIRAKMKAKRGV